MFLESSQLCEYALFLRVKIIYEQNSNLIMRKQRTRQHFIEDFGMNHIEFQILSADCTLQRQYDDYGYEACINTYNKNGEQEEGVIQIQLKSMESLNYSADKKTILFELSQLDLELWLYSDLPVIFIVYDAMEKNAYWIDFLDYFKKNRDTLKKVDKFVQIYIPVENVFTYKTIEIFRQIKNK